MIYEPSLVTVMIQDYLKLEGMVEAWENLNHRATAQAYFYSSMRKLDEIVEETDPFTEFRLDYGA